METSTSTTTTSTSTTTTSISTTTSTTTTIDYKPMFDKVGIKEVKTEKIIIRLSN